MIIHSFIAFLSSLLTEDMATSLLAQENEATNFGKPSAVVKPVQSSKETTSTARPPLGAVANQQNVTTTRGGRRVRRGDGTTRQSRPPQRASSTQDSSTSTRPTQRASSTQDPSTTRQPQRASSTQDSSTTAPQEREGEQRGGRGGGRVATRARTTTRVTRATTTSQNLPLQPRNDPVRQGATSRPQRPLTTRTNTRQQTATAAAGPRTKKTNTAGVGTGASAVGRPPRVAGLVAEDADIRQTDGRYINTRSRTARLAATTSTATAGQGTHTLFL